MSDVETKKNVNLNLKDVAKARGTSGEGQKKTKRPRNEQSAEEHQRAGEGVKQKLNNIAVKSSVDGTPRVKSKEGQKRKRPHAGGGGEDEGKKLKKQKTATAAKTATPKTGEKWTPGDWLCKCGFHNYRRNLKCHRCHTEKPAKLGKKGAWEYLMKWSVKEVDKIDEVHHAWLTSQSGIGNELSDEFFHLFVPYCSALEGAHKAKALEGALKARARLHQIIEALGGESKTTGDGVEGEVSSDSDDSHEKITAKSVAVYKSMKRRGKRGKGKGGIKLKTVDAAKPSSML